MSDASSFASSSHLSSLAPLFESIEIKQQTALALLLFYSFPLSTSYCCTMSNNTLSGLLKTFGNALLAAVAVLEPLTAPFLAVLRYILYLCMAVLHMAGNVVIEITAAFMTAVLSHPNVVNAASQVMVAGMNAFAAQPDLADKLKQVNQHMTTQDKQEAAVQIGRDLPILVGGIFHGVFSRNDDNKKNEDSTNKDGGKKDGGDCKDDKSGEEKDDGDSEKVMLYVNDSGEGKIVEKTIEVH